MKISLSAIALFGLASAIAAPAHAKPAPLTLSQVVVRVLEKNPQLQAAGFDAQASAARIRQQSQATPWEVGVSFDRFAGTGQVSGIRSLETTLSLGRVLEMGDQPKLRGEVARQQAGLLRHRQDAERLDLLAQAATRFVAVARAQAARELALAQLALAKQTVQAVVRRQNAGKAATAERSRVEIDLARAELAREETDHFLANSRRQLAVMWGDFQPQFEQVSADLTRLSKEPDYAELEQALSANPAISQLATLERLSEARLKLARADRRPNLDLNAGVRRYNDTEDTGLMVSLRVPLGSAARAKPYEDEVVALARREPLLANDQRLALRATLFALHQELRHDRDRYETLQARIVPAAEKALADYRRGYAAGRYTLLEFTQAQEVLLQARRELIDAAADHHDNRIQIDRLIGTHLNTGDKS